MNSKPSVEAENAKGEDYNSGVGSIAVATDPLTTASVQQETLLSSAAKRMRLHRQRRRWGMRCLTIEIRETEIDALIHKAILRPEMRNDPISLQKALYAFLDRHLRSNTVTRN